MLAQGSGSCHALTHRHVDVGTQQGCTLAFPEHQHLGRRRHGRVGTHLDLSSLLIPNLLSVLPQMIGYQPICQRDGKAGRPLLC